MTGDLDMTEPTEDQTEPAEDVDTSGGHGIRWRRWAIAAGMFIVFYTIPASFTAHPKACAACHSMKPYYESWASSRHRAAASDCLYCHAKPGTVNRFVYRVTVYKDITTVLSGGRIRLFRTSAVSDESCQQGGCHSMNRLTSLSGQVLINHRLHLEDAEMSCIDCHIGAGHDDVDGRSSNPEMELCEECHQAEMEDCAYCHTGRTLPTKEVDD
jgi:nitrate/TMAO reductase-like tetraheme cytochrome c subunit